MPAPSGIPSTSPAGSQPATSVGSCSESTPSSPQSAGSQPVPSNTGIAVIAVAVSRAATPPRAWLTTVCAGQNPAASRWRPARWRRNPTHSSLPTGGRSAMASPRASPYRRPAPSGTPRSSTAVSDGTMAATHTACGSPARRTSAQAASGPACQALAASCSSSPGAGTRNSWGRRVRARIRPSASTATALTDVVPTSIPIVTGGPPLPLTAATPPRAAPRARHRASGPPGSPGRGGADRRCT